MTMEDGERAEFHAMEDGTRADWQKIGTALEPYARALPDRLIAHLKLLGGDYGGFAVDRLEHCLQTATRAFQAGRDEEYVACALLHDIGDTLGPRNHADVAGAIVQPFVSERNQWIVAQHGIFQGYYFFHHLGLDRDMREKFRGHPHFEATEEFCRLFDQAAFDPNFKSMPLEAFVPMVQRVFEKPQRSLYMRTAVEAAAAE
jgi:predicted HD phosphohydrolase